jgi:hypothetical protein
MKTRQLTDQTKRAGFFGELRFQQSAMREFTYAAAQVHAGRKLPKAICFPLRGQIGCLSQSLGVPSIMAFFRLHRARCRRQRQRRLEEPLDLFESTARAQPLR